jgi:hypothetical protein
MTNAVRLADKVRDLIAAASSWDCEDIPRGPCESRAGLSPSTWCAPCLARALAAEADRMGAGDGEVRGMAEEALRLDERHRVLCDLMEQRRGGSEAHGEIMSIDGKLRGLALKMSRAVLDSARVEGGGGEKDANEIARVLRSLIGFRRDCHTVPCNCRWCEARSLLARLDASRAGGGQ